jgi:hypothetical protein
MFPVRKLLSIWRPDEDRYGSAAYQRIYLHLRVRFSPYTAPSLPSITAISLDVTIQRWQRGGVC